MANRSYLYLKNDLSTRVLCEGIYQIPLFWHCLWGEKELVEPVKRWQLAAELAEQDLEEDIEALVSSDQLAIQVSLDDYRHYAQTNRSFIEEVFPDQLALYDQFLAYIEANVAEGDVLGADVEEIVWMGEIVEAEQELLGNQEAIRRQDKSLIGVNNLFGDSIFSDFTGYTTYYADRLSEISRLITNDDLLAGSSEPEQAVDRVAPVSSQPVAEKVATPSAIEESAPADKSSWKWFGLIIGLVVVLLRYILT